MDEQEKTYITVSWMCMWCGKYVTEETEEKHVEECKYFRVFCRRYAENS